MGRLESGKWTTRWYTPDEKGRFQREATRFRGKLPAAEAGRYHLYVSLACPWAHRTLIARKLKKLEDAISVTVVDPFMGENGWTLPEDPVNGAEYLWQVYVAAKPDYTGRVTVPVLWDKQERTIVNNESRDILRMLDCEFENIADTTVTLCPPELRESIDREIDALYDPVNNGVYRAGFATTQEAYEEGVSEVFAALDRYEERLGKQRFLCGNVLTEADVCFFTTLLRFDPVYHYHFKCNLRRIRDYENIWGYTRDVYQTPGVAETCNLDHIKRHYFQSHEGINPTRIVPKGPIIDYDAPHDRAKLA